MINRKIKRHQTVCSRDTDCVFNLIKRYTEVTITAEPHCCQSHQHTMVLYRNSPRFQNRCWRAEKVTWRWCTDQQVSCTMEYQKVPQPWSWAWPKEQERLWCLFLNPGPAPKGHQQQHSYSQAGQRGASLLHGTRQATRKSRDLAKTVLGSYHEFTRCLPERNRHLSLEKNGLHSNPETPKLDWILGKISSGKEL